MEKRFSSLTGCLFAGLLWAAPFLLVPTAPAAQVIQLLPFYDSFDYNPGSAGLFTASSTVWQSCPSTSNLQVTTNSLTLAGYVPSAGNSLVGATRGVRFAGTQFTSQTAAEGKTVYVSFLYQVTAYPANGTNGVIAFLDATNITSNTMPGTTALALLIDKTGHIGINVGSPSTNGAQYETSATAVNTTVLIVARYTFHTSPAKDVVDLWVNPSSASYGGSAPAPDKTITSAANWPGLAYFSMSYNNNDTTFGEKWDEVRIGATWAQAVPLSNTSGAASAAHSLMVSATPASIVASGASTSVVKMQARDLNGVNLTSGGSTVTFTITNGNGTISSTTDNGDGTYQATLTSSTTVTNAVVTSKLGGTTIATIGTSTNSASLTVGFVAGPVSASASLATANPTNVAADGSSPSTITITAMDAYGHPLAGQNVSNSVSGSGNTVSTPAPTGSNGQTTATLTSTVGETKTVTVTIGSTQINAQPTVTFAAGGVSIFNSTAVASPNAGLVADGVSTSTVTVTAKDGGGNLLSGKTVALAVSGSGNILTQPSPTTDVNGQITATLASTVAQTKTITVTVDGTIISAQPTVAFVPGPATQIAFTSQPVTTPVGVTMPAVVVQIEDLLGNAVTQSGSAVTLALSAGTLSGTNPQTTDANGKATFNDLSIPAISSGLYLTASCAGFSPVQSSVFDAPPKIFYKLNNTSALNLPASWTAIFGGAGPAGPPASDGVGVWETNATGGTVDIGASASWYGLVYRGGAVTVTDTGGGHTLTLGAGSLDGSSAVHSLTMNNNLALGTDQTWKWTAASFTLTVGGNLDNGGHLLTINGQNGNAGEKFNGAITGSGGLTLSSNAAVTLSGTNTYFGNTTVSGGKLIINTNGSIAGTPGIALASGTTLDISAAAPFTVFASQTLSGDTTGTGTATITAKGSNLILASGAQAAFTAAGNVSSNSVTIGKLNVLGGVSLNGNAITVNVTGAPLPAGTYTLMTATNGFTVNGSLPPPVITGQGIAGGATPQIVVNGLSLQLAVGFSVSPASINNTCGDSATFTVTPAAGATSYQWYDPSLQPIPGATTTTLVLNNTHPSDSGAYLIVATGLTGTFTNSAMLLTTDTSPPLITLNGSGTNIIALNSTYTEFGATAYDTCPGNSLTVNTAGTVNTAVIGEYDITYSAVTGAGVPGSQIRVVQVVDPVLNNLVITPSSVAPQCGSNVTFMASVVGLPPITYQWYDNNAKAIPDATNASYTLVDPTDASVGGYTVIAQNAYNALTNSATIASVLHTAPPVMTLNGVSPVYLLLNSPYVDAGATAFDLCAQAGLPVSSNNPVNVSVAGTYTVTYSATTADGTPGTLTRTVVVSAIPNFGPNVLVFDPTMTDIQSQITAVYSQQKYNQFGPQRTAMMFKPGIYTNLDIPLGYYTQVIGLGQSPDDATIIGELYSDGVLVNENATVNFWRGAENLGVIPTNSGNYIIWAVSQGTAFRRMHVHGQVDLANHTDGNFASGGFLADSKIDTTISSIAQQQWLSRNDVFGNWSGGVWNMVFVGVSNPPAGTWPTKVYTVITNTPLIAEKPYLYLDTNGNYTVMVPALQTNSSGITWGSGPTLGTSIPISQFYVAHPDTDTAASINTALNAGLNLILTPGIYQLSSSLMVTRPDTIVLGLGYPTLIPQTGTPALTISDVDGVKVGGLLFDAGPVQTATLLQVGAGTSSLDHSGDPIFLYDIFMRVGGANAGSTLSCLQIDANDVVGDNLWLWRADHGAGVGWNQNVCNNGLIVNGDRVTIYGLFVEHQQQYQTLWNGDWGRVYFYQSELPYDPPSQAAWSHDGVNGYASYKVADSVTSHQAYGLGVYAVFIDCVNISCFNAIETPTNSQQVNLHNMITVYIAGNTSGGGTSTLDHIINGTGATLAGPGFGGTAKTNSLWLNPAFSISAAMMGANAAITFPTESWHTYQLQYKNALTDPSWSNLGSPFGGNDTLLPVQDPNPATSRLYRMMSF
ncbi:MAG TPA: invasin domain 3-containing protein [Verrucomicrobiae bacterium]|nr:invasin domain 3-containing protein [Verrucomicrobiae bacterium]